MGVDRLAVLLHVVGDPRPGAGDLEVAPPVGGHRVRVVLGRLPAPQAVEADPLARRRRLAVRLVQVPDRLDSVGELRVGLQGGYQA